MLQEVGELGMLTLDDSVTLQCSLYKGRCTAASPREQSTKYIVRVTVPPYLPSTTTRTPFALLQVNYFILSFSFFFHGVVYSPMLPASYFG